MLQKYLTVDLLGVKGVMGEAAIEEPWQGLRCCELQHAKCYASDCLLSFQCEESEY